MRLFRKVLEYDNKQLYNYITGQELHESVLKSNSVPRDMGKTPKPGTFVKSLSENLKKYQIKNHKALVKIQTDSLSVVGPQTKLWSVIDETLNSNEDKIELTMRDWFYNKVLYNRCIQLCYPFT